MSLLVLFQIKQEEHEKQVRIFNQFPLKKGNGEDAENAEPFSAVNKFYFYCISSYRGKIRGRWIKL
jgi:hypothetical protein